MGNPKGDGSSSGGYEKIDIPKNPPPLYEAPSRPVTNARVKGVDVSKWQPKVDYAKLYSEWDCRFVFAKASDGQSGKDPAFDYHRAEAKKAGMLFGAYHYFRFEVDPIEQVRMFLKAIGEVQVGELPPVLDVEWDRYSKKYGEGHEMDAAAAESVFACITRLEKDAGITPLIYTNAYFFNPGKYSEGFQRYPLWVPNYGAKDISQVKIPKPWKKATFWQYSESLKLGAADKIDGDYFLGSLEELKGMVRK